MRYRCATPGCRGLHQVGDRDCSGHFPPMDTFCLRCQHVLASHAGDLCKACGVPQCGLFVAPSGDVQPILGTAEQVNHPQHYGGKDNPYEAIKVIEAWQLGFCLGNAIKYISRAGKKDPTKELEDLEKAMWYLNRRIEQIQSSQGEPKKP